MKIKSVKKNNRKKSFEIVTYDEKVWLFPYSRLACYKDMLKTKSYVSKVYVDKELAREGFTFELESGREDSVVMDEVLEYNKDPDYMREMLLYELTVQVRKIIEKKKISHKEIMRRMGIKDTPFYRLIDTTYYGKTIDQMQKLFAALDYKLNISLKKVA